jgi:hypothetical protein
MSPRPTMVDVARSADVSLKTVSRSSTARRTSTRFSVSASLRRSARWATRATWPRRACGRGGAGGSSVSSSRTSATRPTRRWPAAWRPRCARPVTCCSPPARRRAGPCSTAGTPPVEQRFDGLIVVPPPGAGPRLLTAVDALPPVVRDAVRGSHDVGCGPVGHCRRPAGPQIRIQQSDLTSHRLLDQTPISQTTVTPSGTTRSHSHAGTERRVTSAASRTALR